ncbi:MAG: T9SS type A sorting domain-containing protein [Cyclobacteriaceae bacterium]
MKKSSDMRRFLYTTITIWFLQVCNLNASHILGGYINATKVSSTELTYQINVVLMTDGASGVNIGQGGIEFGDGTKIDLQGMEGVFEPGVSIGFKGQIVVKRAQFMHAFPGAGVYKISFSSGNRNAGILNMANPIDTPFYLETLLVIDPFLGTNDLPEIMNVKMPLWLPGQAGYFNVAAFDTEGDSLSFRLGVPRQLRNKTVGNYKSPADAIFYNSEFARSNESGDGPPVLNLNPISGDLLWNAPGMEGEYASAIIIDEWREIGGKRYRMSQIYFDFNLVVESKDVPRPLISMPENRCYEEGTVLEETFVVEGENDTKVILYTDARGAKINGIPFEQFDFEVYKLIHQLNFTYDTKIADRQYYKVVLGIEQPGINGINHYWSRSFFFGLNCDRIAQAPQLVTSAREGLDEPKIATHFTQTSGSFYLDNALDERIEFRLYDINGRTLVGNKVAIAQGMGQVQFDPIPSGIYVLSFTVENRLYKQKVWIK